MSPYVIFLRGVMPTGKNKVPMGPLREVLAEAGFANVRTYIQSGNVLASSRLSATEVEQLVHDEITRHFGGDIAVIARTPAQVRSIVGGNPFKDVDMAMVYFVMLSRKPDEAKVRQLSPDAFLPNRFVIADEAAYLYCPDGYSNSKINSNSLEKKLGLSATMRSYNTMTRLIELSKEA
jgi:uncharacterized protein (DUF1697 family)